MNKQVLTQEEINERVAILKRFRMLLEQQRNKFREYLFVLEKQASVIEKEDTESLVAHTELEQQIVANISNLQKVIEPMEILYSENNIQSSEIAPLKSDLLKLQQQVLVQNRQNCNLLKTQMTVIRSKMASFKNPYKNTKSIYANQDHTATMISIEG